MDIEIKFYIVFMYHETLFSIYFQPLKNVKKKKKTKKPPLLAHKSYNKKWLVGFGSQVIVCQPL